MMTRGLQTLMTVGALALLVAALSTGCSNSDNNSTGSNLSTTPQIASVAPADGASGIPVTTSLSIKFDRPMDTLSVMEHVHLSGGAAMHEWMDSLMHTGGMMGGGMGMHRGHMMNWMDTIQVHGEFHWNAEMDSCEFVPDSALMSSTEYMMALCDSLMSHDGMFMDMSHLPYETFMSHFTCGP